MNSVAPGVGVGVARPVVLVVDDDERNRLLMRGILSAELRVVEAADGQQALGALELEPVDLVLLDVMMPGLSGIETCARIKARRPGEFLPVILVTALSEQSERNAGLAAGADDYLTKPVDRRELRLRVATLLRTRRQDAEIRRQLKSLRELDALKEDLVSLLVHDIRSPLAGLIGILRIVADDVTSPETREDIATALEASSRINRMLEDLLEVHRIEHGHAILSMTRARASQVATRALAHVEAEARAREVTLDVDVEASLELTIDESLVSRALANLLTNAIRHVGDDRTVVLSLHAKPEERTICIDVIDRGSGVPDSLKASLFQKFSGLSEQVAMQARRGFGLGLYMVRLVASAHGGMAQVLDRPGGGSIFRITLPLGTP